MDHLLRETAEAAMNHLAEHASVVELSNTDEFTFRAFFLSELKRRLPEAQCQTEWNWVDLLVRNEGRSYLVEFKYYLNRRSIRLDGTPGNWKGGPSPKNENEFRQCVQKLHTCGFDPVAGKYLVIAYEKTNPRNSGYCYDRSYGGLIAEGPIEEVVDVQHQLDSMVCKLLRIA